MLTNKPSAWTLKIFLSPWLDIQILGMYVELIDIFMTGKSIKAISFGQRKFSLLQFTILTIRDEEIPDDDGASRPQHSLSFLWEKTRAYFQ